jgi:hypothetical protein
MRPILRFCDHPVITKGPTTVRSPNHLYLQATLAALCCGCSFFMVPSPPSDPSERTQEAADECNANALAPAGDALVAAVGALNLGIAASANSDEKIRWYTAELDPGTGMALGAAQLALFGAAATYGFIQLSRCYELRREVQSGGGARPGTPRSPSAQ